MASNLVPADGSGLANASTYETAANIRTYALTRGIELAPDDDAGDALVDIMAIKAMDYLESNRDKWQGWKATTTQRLTWPRAGVLAEMVAGTSWWPQNGYENIIMPGYQYRDPTIIPAELKEAQCRLVLKVKADVDLLPTQSGSAFVTREKIGPIETVYSEAIGAYSLPRMPDVDLLLAPLLKPVRGAGLAYRG